MKDDERRKGGRTEILRAEAVDRREGETRTDESERASDREAGREGS